MMSEHKRKAVARLRKENCYVPDNYDDDDDEPPTSSKVLLMVFFLYKRFAVWKFAQQNSKLSLPDHVDFSYYVVI